MANGELRDALSELRPDDIRVDAFGRVIITAPSVNDKLKGIGNLRPDELAKGDTNWICCGNGSCPKAEDLGSILGRFAVGASVPGRR